MPRSKVTYTSDEGVWITVTGQPRKSKPGGLPRVPDDDGLVLRLLEFMREQEIYARVGTSSCGPGTFSGFFRSEDAAKVCLWLRSQMARRKSR